MLLSKFFPIPAPFHRSQAHDMETGPYYNQTKRALGWRRFNLSTRPFLVWMLPWPVSCCTWTFQLLETNSLGSWSLLAFPPRLLYPLCVKKSTSTQITHPYHQGFPRISHSNSNNWNFGRSQTQPNSWAHQVGDKDIHTLVSTPIWCNQELNQLYTAKVTSKPLSEKQPSLSLILKLSRG